jgi:hypothetical protein
MCYTLLASVPFFTGRSINPLDFLRQFNAAIEDSGLSEKEQIVMFKTKIRVEDESWREGLRPHKHRLKDYQKAFRREYFGRSEQKLIKTEFKEARIVKADMPTIFEFVRHWFTTLSSLTDSEYDEESIIDELIKKLPPWIRPYLGNQRIKKFKKFKEKLVNALDRAGVKNHNEKKEIKTHEGKANPNLTNASRQEYVTSYQKDRGAVRVTAIHEQTAESQALNDGVREFQSKEKRTTTRESQANNRYDGRNNNNNRSRNNNNNNNNNNSYNNYPRNYNNRRYDNNRDDRQGQNDRPRYNERADTRDNRSERVQINNSSNDCSDPPINRVQRSEN